MSIMSSVIPVQGIFEGNMRIDLQWKNLENRLKKRNFRYKISILTGSGLQNELRKNSIILEM